MPDDLAGRIPPPPREVPLGVGLRNLFGRNGHDSRLLLGLCLAALLFGAAFAPASDWSPLSFRIFQKDQTQGRVLDIRPCARMPEDRKTLEVRFSYSTPAGDREGLCWVPAPGARGGLFWKPIPPFQVGDAVPVEILRRNGLARIAGACTSWGSLDAEAFCGAGFLLFACFALLGAPRRGWRGNRLLRSGRLCRAQLISAEEWQGPSMNVPSRGRSRGSFWTFGYRLVDADPEQSYWIRSQTSDRDFKGWAWCLYREGRPGSAILLSELAALPEWAQQLAAMPPEPAPESLPGPG